MEKTKTFLNDEKGRDKMAKLLSKKGWCTHIYRYVAGGSLVYCVRYWN